MIGIQLQNVFVLCLRDCIWNFYLSCWSL